MNQERNLGLQWRVALICLAAGVAGSTAALIVFLYTERAGYDYLTSLGFGLGVAFFIGLAAAIIASLITRTFKLRLWEAGRLAGLISRGDYRARLEIGGDDEVGWLEVQLNEMADQLERAINNLKDMAEQNRMLGEEAGRGAALEERMRLSRDLHDTVNQQLFVMAMRAAAIKRRLEEQAVVHQPLIEEIQILEELARQAHSQIRELILELRPVTLEREGLGAALSEYSKNIAKREGWVLDSSIDQNLKPERSVAESLFRIAQEVLNNVSKHADAKNIRVVLALENDEVLMSIADDGSGFAVNQASSPTSLGIAGIRERVKALKGKLDIGSAPGRGTSVDVRAPLVGEGNGE